MQPCKSINCFFDYEFRMPVEVQMQRVYDGGFRHLDMNFWDWSHDPASPFRADNWKDWMRGIAEAAARMRDQGHVAHLEMFVVPRPGEQVTLDRVTQLRDHLHELHWRLHDVVVVPTERLPEFLASDD